jgi:hypothetical protein
MARGGGSVGKYFLKIILENKNKNKNKNKNNNKIYL